MEHIIENQLKALLDLQALDCQLDHITKMRGALPEEVAALGHDLAALQTRAQNIREECSHLEQDIATQRVNIKTIEALVKKYEAQQIDVRNNREYDAITKEVDLQKLEMQLAGKRIKDAYGRIDKQKIELEQSQVLLEKNQKVLEDKQGELQVLIDESEGEERKMHAQRVKVTQYVDAKLLKVYERIRNNVRNKLAVVVVKREACGGCFNKVPAQKQADIQKRKNIVVCEHCGRIIADVISPLEDV